MGQVIRLIVGMLAIAGAMRCWGDNSGGELGDGNPPAHATPTQSLIYCR